MCGFGVTRKNDSYQLLTIYFVNIDDQKNKHRQREKLSFSLCSFLLLISPVLYFFFYQCIFCNFVSSRSAFPLSSPLFFYLPQLPFALTFAPHKSFFLFVYVFRSSHPMCLPRLLLYRCLTQPLFSLYFFFTLSFSPCLG